MKSILNYFRKRKDRKLRERCVKYALQQNQGYIILEANKIYKFICNRENS